jgi:hypothetical protein
MSCGLKSRRYLQIIALNLTSERAQGSTTRVAKASSFHRNGHPANRVQMSCGLKSRRYLQIIALNLTSEGA